MRLIIDKSLEILSACNFFFFLIFQHQFQHLLWESVVALWLEERIPNFPSSSNCLCVIASWDIVMASTTQDSMKRRVSLDTWDVPVMTISLSLPFLHTVCHPLSHSVTSLSPFFCSSNPMYSHHLLTSEEEGQKLSRDKRVSRKRVNSGHQNDFQTTSGSRRKKRYFLHQHKKEHTIFDWTGYRSQGLCRCGRLQGMDSVAREHGGHLTAG